ncbi:MAG: hypothetical protein JWL97_3718 [Gemmatimonadales bacterium]|nr:hypothetical protein [Gemmatimonadales bacterium]
MAEGTTSKACGCRDEETGRRLGKKCPKLRRASGSWSSQHGNWFYQLELPLNSDGSRRGPLRRAGFDSQKDAEAEMAQAVELLAIAGDDESARVAIADLIIATVKATKKLPEPQEVRRKVRTGQDLGTTITTGQWLNLWLSGRKKLSPRTRRSYEGHIRLYLIPHIGTVPLDKLRVSDVESVFEGIDELNDAITQARTSGDPALRAKVKGRRTIKPATRQRIRATLRAALNKAIRERRIDINVAALVELESGKRPKALVWTDERITGWRHSYDRYVTVMQQRHHAALQAGSTHRKTAHVKPLDAYIGAERPSPVMVWTPAQTGLFLDQARGHRLYAQYHLIAFRGLRRGESCGLRWQDLDLEEGTATVRWQIIQAVGGTEQGQPKSEAGDRQVSLDKITVKELKAHKARQNTERLAAGKNWTESGFVFTTETGQPLQPWQVSDDFVRLAMAAGQPPIRLHDLRHGAATILLRAGHDMKVVQETLGLSSITIAADTYTSVLPELAKQSAEDAATILLNAAKNNRKRTAQPTPTRQAQDPLSDESPTDQTAQEAS